MENIFALPWGEYTLKLMGKLEIPLLVPVRRSVSASISLRISSKSPKIFPLQCRNSPYSAAEKENVIFGLNVYNYSIADLG